jgi:hypothetical protein
VVASIERLPDTITIIRDRQEAEFIDKTEIKR